MDNKQKPKVPVTDADKAKHYFKYYEREPAFMAPQKMGKVFGPPMNPADAVDYEKQHKLINTARVFLKKAHYFGAIRFDIAEVTYNVDECGEYHFSLNYIKNAFPADELMPD